jgi:site-specific recombinase XerD
MQLDEAISAHLASLEAEGRSARTVATYKRDLATLRAELGDVSPRTVTPPPLLAWVSSDRVLLRVDGGPRNRSTTNRARSAVRGLFGFLTANWIIDRNPALVLRVKTTRPPPATTLSVADEVTLLTAMGEAGSWEAHRDVLIVPNAVRPDRARRSGRPKP